MGEEKETIFKQKIYSKIGELPTIPVIATKLLYAIDDEQSSISDVVEIIQNDPSLTSKILKIANSAYYGFSREIKHISQAVALLGFNMVRSLVISLEVMKNLPSGRESEYFSPEGLWLHSLATATCMEDFRKKYPDRKNSSTVFITGLLHDIGKVVLDQFFHEEFLKALSLANGNPPKSLHHAEQELIGLDHTEVAGMLLERWKFPEEIVKPIANMHAKEIDENLNIQDLALLRIANSIAQETKIGKEGNSVPNKIKEKDLEILSIDEKILSELREDLKNSEEKIEEFFGVLRG